ncbi:hypothetical protein ANRL3_00765 [Anaerolineae bacterium]|nr:hypothetical protein ANRL3_00765 [Anaerolineae bacterium]
MMTPNELIERRKTDWERLTAILQRVQRGQLHALNEAELIELGQLYRAATSDLALARRDFPRHTLTNYLNQLVGQAHPLIYRGEPFIARQLFEFYARGLPRLFRELAPFIIVAAILFFGAGILSYAATIANPDAANYVLPAQTIEMIKSGKMWWKELNGMNQVGSAMIMTNNLRVTFFAFAGGILLGLFTLYTLIFNGLHLGMVLGLMQFYGHAEPLWEFIVGHGVIELSVVTFAGGSGLMLGYAILQPGLLSRKDALIVAAQKSVRLLLGTAPLLVIAGLIEGLISPSDAPAFLKYGIGIASGILLYAYLFFAGRAATKKLRWRNILRRMLAR